MKKEELKSGMNVKIFRNGKLFIAKIHHLNRLSIQARFEDSSRGCFTVTTIPYRNVIEIINEK